METEGTAPLAEGRLAPNPRFPLRSTYPKSSSHQPTAIVAVPLARARWAEETRSEGLPDSITTATGLPTSRPITTPRSGGITRKHLPQCLREGVTLPSFRTTVEVSGGVRGEHTKDSLYITTFLVL